MAFAHLFLGVKVSMFRKMIYIYFFEKWEVEKMQRSFTFKKHMGFSIVSP